MDDQYLARLVDLVRWYGPPDQAASPGADTYRTRFFLYTIDGAYLADGTPDPASFNYVSNEYVIALADALDPQDPRHERIHPQRLRCRRLRQPPPGRRRRRPAGHARDRGLDAGTGPPVPAHGVRHIKWRPPT